MQCIAGEPFLARKVILIAVMLVMPHLVLADEADTLPEVDVKASKEALTARGSADGKEFVSPVVQSGILGDKSNLEVPFTIQSYTRDLIQAQQSRTVGDVLKNDASTRNLFNSAGYAPTMSIRGFDTFNALWDGMLGGFAFGYQDFPLEVVDAVEVMKGPSALLFGAGSIYSPAGSINYVPKRAPLTGGAPIRRVTTGVQTGGAINFSADLGDRFGADNQFGYRVNASHRKGGLAQDLIKLDEQALLVSFDWKATDTLKFIVDVGKINSEKEAYADVYVISPGIKIPRTPDNKTNASQKWASWNADREFVLVKADWQFAQNWNLNLAATKSRHNFDYIQATRSELLDEQGNLDVSPLSADPYYIEATSLQATLRGKLNTGPIVHDVVLSSTRDRSTEKSRTNFIYPNHASNIYDPVRIPFSGVPIDADTETLTDPKIKTHRLIDTLHLGQFDFILGVGRVSIEDFVANEGEGYKKAKTTPLAGLLYKIDPSLSIYTSYAEGFEMGGRAPIIAANANEIMPPLTSEQIEIGIKKDFGAFQA